MEVLLALAVSTVVLAAIGGVFFSALRLRERTTTMLDEAAPLQRALGIIRRDLHGTVAPQGFMTAVFATSSSDVGGNQTYLLRLRTTTGSLKAESPWSEVQEVGYRLRAPLNRSAEGSDLFRTVNHNLISTFASEPEEQWLLGKVRSLHLDCYDGRDWRTAWDLSSGDTNLPVAVRLRLQMAGSDDRSDSPVEMIIPLVAQSWTNQAAGGAQ